MDVDVYAFTDECEANGMKYRDGQTFYIPQNPIVYNDMGCQICSCDRGAKNCYGRASCDFFFPCEKFVPAAQGKCCPTCGKFEMGEQILHECDLESENLSNHRNRLLKASKTLHYSLFLSACYHKNKYYKDGQTWINRQPNSCYECACVSSQTKCKVVQCAANCPNPVYEPGKCCPTCSKYIKSLKSKICSLIHLFSQKRNVKESRYLICFLALSRFVPEVTRTFL